MTKANTVTARSPALSQCSDPKTKISYTLTLEIVLKAQPLCNLGLGHDLRKKKPKILAFFCFFSHEWHPAIEVQRCLAWKRASAGAAALQLLIFNHDCPLNHLAALKDRPKSCWVFFLFVQLFSFLPSHLLYGYHGNNPPPPPSRGTRYPPQLENSGGQLVSSGRGTSILQSDSCDGSPLLYLRPPGLKIVVAADAAVMRGEGGSNMVKSAKLSG